MRRTLVLAALAVAACRDGKTMAVKPVLTVEPTALDFGKVKVGRGGPGEVKLRSGSQAAVHVTGLAIEGDIAFSAPPDPAVIAGFGGLTIPLTLLPGAVRAYSATLVLSSDDEEHPEIRVPLTGEGATAAIEVTPAAVQFMPEPAERAAEPPRSFWPTVRIASTGAVELELTVAIEGPDAASFALLETPTAVMPAGASTELPVKFDPNAAQRFYSAELVVRSDDPAKPVVRVPLAGELRANLPPIICANITRVRPGDGSPAIDYADWGPPPDAGYDFTRSREVQPNAVVELSAFSSADERACTTDPEDERIALTYLWEVISSPSGPPPGLTGATSPTARLVPFAAGAYRLRLTVADVQRNTSTVELELLAAVKQDLVAQLSWVGSPGVDLDVHLVRPGSQPFSFFSEGAASRTSGDVNGWSQLARAADAGFDFEWGDPGPFDDPRLNIDDTGAGALLENVSVNYPEHASQCAASECTYQVLVHWFRDARDAGSSTSACTVDGTSCRDGDACDCAGGLRCVANLAPISDAGAGAGTCRAAVKPVVRVFTRGAQAAVIPLDTLMPADPLALGAPCQLLHVADVVWPRRGADAGSPRVDVIGQDDAGYLTAPSLTRWGYRPNASGQCSPNTTQSGRAWFAPSP